MILDVQPPVMRRLYLYGALEVKFFSFFNEIMVYILGGRY